METANHYARYVALPILGSLEAFTLGILFSFGCIRYIQCCRESFFRYNEPNPPRIAHPTPPPQQEQPVIRNLFDPGEHRQDISSTVIEITGTGQNPSPNSESELQRRRNCVICLSEKVTTALTPCGHLVICSESACLNILNGKCPICRSDTLLAVRIFT
jgi:hypothetical protein